MKKLNLFLGIICAFAVCLVSCTKEKATGRIQGIVTNMNTTEPIQGVNISLSPTGASAVTGSDGRYEFNNLEVGNYTVQGVKAGFESNTKNISITAGNVSSGDMQLRPTVSGFRLNVEYLDFSTNFSQLQFKIINASATLPLSWEIMESMNWMTVTPSTGNLQGGQEVTVTVNIDRSLITQSTSANLTVRSADQSIVLPVNVSVSGNNGPQLQLSENSIDFGTSANSLTFYVMNTGPANTSLQWFCSNINVGWLTLNPMSGNTAGGASTQVVTALVDRTKITGPVSTTVTVTGTNNSANLNVAASYVDNTLVVADGLFCFFNFDGEEITDYYGNYTGLNVGAVASTDTPSGEGKSMQFYSPVKWTTNSASNYVDNRWHMLTLTFDGNTGMIFIDGVLFETKANNELKWASDANTCYLGTTADKNGNIKFFNGKLDNFRSYNRALTAQEVQMLFNAKQ